MNNKGFSLIEILVSIAIFSVVMVTAAGALLATIDTNHKAQAIQSAMNNLSFALESMSRPIREGKFYHCGNTGTLTNPQDCPGGDNFFAFKRTSDGLTVSYYLSNNQIVRNEDVGTAVAVTAPEVIVQNLKFYVNGAEAADKQSLVTIVIQGYVGEAAKIRTPFNLQTTLSQRMPK